MIKLEDKIAEELGEKVVKELGAGDFGEAFLLESGKVLKLTSDINEIVIAKKLVRYKRLFKNILNYYNVGEIDSYIKFPPRHPHANYKYFILMDYVNPLSRLEKASINYAYKSLLQFSKSFYKSVFHPNFIDSILYRFSLVRMKDERLTRIYTEDEIKQMKQIAIDFIPYVKEIAKDLKLHHIEQCDFHGGNLGWNEDHTKLILFDITTPIKHGIDKLLMPELKLKKYAVYEYHGEPAPNQIKSRITQIANKLGEEIDMFLGSGAFGYAYRTKSNKVLKITSDFTEAKIAYKLAKNRNWTKCIVNFYSVGKIDFKKSMNIDLDIFEWYILMDYLNGLNEKEQEAVDAYMGLIQYKPDFYSNIMDKSEVMDHLNFIFDESGDKDRIASKGIDPIEVKKIAIDFYPKIVNIIKDLKKHGVKETDFHSDNVGWDRNYKNLVLFDIGGNLKTNWVNFINAKFKIKSTTEKLITRFKAFL